MSTDEAHKIRAENAELRRRVRRLEGANEALRAVLSASDPAPALDDLLARMDALEDYLDRIHSAVTAGTEGRREP